MPRRTRATTGPPKATAAYEVSHSNANNIEIHGARTHNLKNIDLDIPRGKLTVITGVSGSGKSSLAFDTLFAEGQRQYLQSLSSYTRQFVDQMERPHVDRIRGLQPTLCIDQQSGTLSPRSTVGTISEIYDYLRLLMARVGIPWCSKCGAMIDRQTTTSIEESMCSLPEGTRLTILSPIVVGRKGAHLEVFEQMTKAGLVRAQVDGEMIEIESPPMLNPRREHSIAAVVDRVIVRPENLDRIRSAVQTALRLSHGMVSSSISVPEVQGQTQTIERLYSIRFACASCGESIPDIEPRTFSFNSAYGACRTCEGYGYVQDEPGNTCPDCNGNRLRPESLSIRLQGRSIADIVRMPLGECRDWLASLEWNSRQAPVSEPILKEIAPRLTYLEKVGLGYLTLDRSGASLSGGELQRVRLATSVGTGLIGVCYVLDEPSIGLHPRDTDRLIGILRSLQSQGNTVVVVEHDDSVMKAADLLVDIGPGAGKNGGEIMAVGAPSEFNLSENSLTSQYLSGRRTIPISRNRRIDVESPRLSLSGVNLHNVCELDVKIPLGVLVGITGVSGSGKSTLIHDSLAPSVIAALASGNLPKHVRSIAGIENIDKLIEIDQSPIGRSPRSVPATYCGLWDDIRKIFATTRDAKLRGFKAARFSFNSGDGRCSECGGLGRQKLEMSFLEDVSVPCPECLGQRFNRPTLNVRFKDRNIADVLSMSIDSAAEYFENVPSIKRKLDVLIQVGLGYLAVGQSSSTLSGGESQRLKLANELMRTDTGKTLYVFDEPTTGLHMDDVVRLIGVFQGLVDRGNSVIVVEHHMHLIRCCDWIIDMGPDGGTGGGKIVGEGTPESIATLSSPTGLALEQIRNMGSAST